MPSPRSTVWRQVRRLGVRLLLVGAVVGGAWGLREWNRPPKPTLAGLTFVAARRADLNAILNAAGKTESAENTVIECQLERLEMRNEGQSISAGGSSTILWVIDDGSEVKKGDVICRLDSSEYEELVRTQEIKFDRARADLDAAKLDVEAAEMGLDEFRKGLKEQTFQQYEGQLKLSESDVARSKDRLEWSKKMRQKGYASADQVATDEATLQRAEHAVKKAKWELDLFQRFGASREIHSLEADVQSYRATLVSNQMRFDRSDDRLQNYKKMVDFCTIRAPHDGFVIYVKPNGWFSNFVIEPGARVRQMQDMFMLPDLKNMRVNALIHESVVARVELGMKVRVRIEGMSNRELTGRVIKVNPLPDGENSWISDVKFFRASIQLDEPPPGLLPEMTAQVEIELGRRANVVTIPNEAVEIVGGKDFCYVADGDKIERRPVTVGGSDRDLLEVIEGLEEGEEVVFDPSHIEAYAPLIVDAPPAPSSDATGRQPAVAASAGDQAPAKPGLIPTPSDHLRSGG
jgi:HlyD family secretion protein